MHPHNRKLIKVLAVILFSLMNLTLCQFCGKTLLVCKETLTPSDVIIVLGHRSQPSGQPSEIMQARVERGVELYFRGYAPNILFTGGETRKGFVEAEIMANLAIKSGIPTDAIVKETRSRNTIENAQFSAEIVQENEWHSAIVVTSPYHTRRAIALFRNQGVNVIGCAAPETRDLPSQIGAIIYEAVNWIWLFITHNL